MREKEEGDGLKEVLDMKHHAEINNKLEMAMKKGKAASRIRKDVAEGRKDDYAKLVVSLVGASDKR